MKPLGDRLVVKVIEEPDKVGNLWIPDAAKARPTRGIVVATGPGKRVDGVTYPMSVSVGNEVLFGRFGGTEVKIEGQSVLIIPETDVYGILSCRPA